MKKAKAVSIVIPVYNEQGHLRSCLESIARQSVAPLEVVVVDNNSTDQSCSIAEQFPFVRLVHEPEQGIVYARNRGFNTARGHIIGRIDADSVLPEDWVQRISEFYAGGHREHVAVTGGVKFYDVGLSGLASWLYNLLIFDFNRLLIGYPTLWGSNMAITNTQWRYLRADICGQNGIHEDLDMAIHQIRAGGQISHDRSLKVNASLRRAESGKHELWDYLQWWPRTLRRHGYVSWVVCWLIGCLGIYLAMPLFKLVVRLGQGSQRLTRAVLGIDPFEA